MYFHLHLSGKAKDEILQSDKMEKNSIKNI